MADDARPADPWVACFKLAARLVDALVAAGQTLATAESLTGGAVGATVTAVPGSSAAYLGGVVSYATRVKQEQLGVREETVREHGVVSAVCAEEMAVGARDRLGATWGLSTTGVAGPDTQEGKPVGLVYVGVAGPTGVSSTELHLDGDRADVRTGAVRAVLEAALEQAWDRPAQVGTGPTDGTEGPDPGDPVRSVGAEE